ncbi:MAG: VOC family protein [Pyrinomonadaceae bacterium]
MNKPLATENMAQDNDASNFNRPTKLAHIVYRTRRFEQMLEWYKTVFGARVQYQNPALCFITYDDEHHRFLLADMSVIQPNGKETQSNSAIGVDHVAYTYASLSDLFESYSRLKEKGINPYWCIHHGITISMYYADPDGNQMEFQVDCFETSEESNAFFKDKWDANPVGVEIDAEDWLSQMRAGVPASDFLERKVHEPISPIRGNLAEFL